MSDQRLAKRVIELEKENKRLKSLKLSTIYDYIQSRNTDIDVICNIIDNPEKVATCQLTNEAMAYRKEGIVSTFKAGMLLAFVKEKVNDI